ncbi:hypothetical protein AB1Y20_011583 [Prymnesium parvum]|uniref:ATP-dependent Clp protease proteolytic subunit n=1 Tax=Prymnesium parvum TaxID=97485 RepID=A0AB34IJG3_PRYPA
MARLASLPPRAAQRLSPRLPRRAQLHTAARTAAASPSPRLAALCAAVGAAAAGAASCEAKRTEKPPPAPKSMAELVTALSIRARHVFVTGKITDDSARVVIAQLLFLEQAKPGEPIYMHINSGGGKVHAGLAINDVMRAISSPVHTTCLGHCESMAAVLLAAGERGCRYALPNSRIMIHQPVRGSSSKSNASELTIQAAELDRSRQKLASLLAEACGRPVAELEAIIERDRYYSAQEAREMGLVDAIGGGGLFSRSGAKESAPEETTAETGEDGAFAE